MEGLLGGKSFLSTKLRDLAGHQVIHSAMYSVANTIFNLPGDASLSLRSRTALGKPSLPHS